MVTVRRRVFCFVNDIYVDVMFLRSLGRVAFGAAIVVATATRTRAPKEAL